MVIVAFFRAGGARTCVTQPLEAKMGLMAVVPLDVHSSTGGNVDFDRLGVNYGHTDQYIQNLGTRFVLTYRRTNGKLLHRLLRRAALCAWVFENLANSNW